MLKQQVRKDTQCLYARKRVRQKGIMRKYKIRRRIQIENEEVVRSFPYRYIPANIDRV